MADTEKTVAKATEPEKTAVKPAAPPPTDDRERPAPKRAKLVAETGRYICKEPIVYSSPEGKRMTAKIGDVVTIQEGDARALKKRRSIESEEEMAEA